MNNKSLTRSAGVIASLYICVASTWIVFSDRWVIELFGDTDAVSTAQTAKGGLFVAITGVLLYVLMRHALARVEAVAFNDRLSGLPNRLAFGLELELRCAKAAVQNGGFTLTILDIDHFTDLNDELGHLQADALLVALSQRLRETLDASWFVAHMGGDEFGLLSPIGADTEICLAALDDLQWRLTRESSSQLMNEQTISAGTSRFPEDGPSSNDLFRHEDMALSSAKRKGRNRHKVYGSRLKHSRLEQIVLLKELKRACANGDFSLVYQPQWSVKGRCWSGAEVLVRWDHRDRGSISPEIFIPLAEREGLISSITEFVFTQALDEVKVSGIDRTNLRSLSINLSHAALTDAMVRNRLLGLLNDTAFAGRDIILEITETAAMQDLSRTLRAMNEWRKHGVFVVAPPHAIPDRALWRT